MSDNTTAGPESRLPKGLAVTIAAFAAGCNAKDANVAADVAPRIEDRFRKAYQAGQKEWDAVAMQVLTIARLAGRLAALYAQLDGQATVDWSHARYGLRDAQADCQAIFRDSERGKHCRDVDLRTP